MSSKNYFLVFVLTFFALIVSDQSATAQRNMTPFVLPVCTTPENCIDAGCAQGFTVEFISSSIDANGGDFLYEICAQQEGNCTPLSGLSHINLVLNDFASCGITEGDLSAMTDPLDPNNDGVTFDCSGEDGGADDRDPSCNLNESDGGKYNSC
jgi:hypothetical protein